MPLFPHDGFGYVNIENNKNISKNFNPYKVKKFVEKPSKQKAKKMIKDKNYFWNSGIFIASSTLVINTVKRYEDDIALNCDALWKNRFIEHNETFFCEKIFSKIRAKSIDYTLMENSNKIIMYKLDVGWNDVGSWDNFFKTYSLKKDRKNIISVNGKNNYIYPSTKNIATIDVDNLIIVDSPNSLLISKKGSSDKLREVSKKLQNYQSNNLEQEKFLTVTFLEI